MDVGLPATQLLYALEKNDLLGAFAPPMIDTYAYYGFGQRPYLPPLCPFVSLSVSSSFDAHSCFGSQCVRVSLTQLPFAMRQFISP